MFNQHLCIHTLLSIIKLAVSIQTTITTMKKGLAQNIIWIVVLMIPNKWNDIAIMMLKSIVHDSSTIRALEIRTSGPTRKVVIIRTKLLHFDLLPPFQVLQPQT